MRRWQIAGEEVGIALCKLLDGWWAGAQRALTFGGGACGGDAGMDSAASAEGSPGNEAGWKMPLDNESFIRVRPFPIR